MIYKVFFIHITAGAFRCKNYHCMQCGAFLLFILLRVYWGRAVSRSILGVVFCSAFCSHSALARLRAMSVIVESEPRRGQLFSENFYAPCLFRFHILYAEMKINMRRIKNLLYNIKNFYLDY